jgi:hypothetical protein
MKAEMGNIEHPMANTEHRMNSRNKGKVGEREFASLLREYGYDARRGQQFSGGADSPDVVSEALAWLHFEIKRVQNLNLADACAQAEGDSAGKPWIVAHRRNHAPWLITMRAEFFFDLIRQFEPPRRQDAEVLTADEHGFFLPQKSAKDTEISTPHPGPLPGRGGEGEERTARRSVPAQKDFRRDAEKDPRDAGATLENKT